MRASQTIRFLIATDVHLGHSEYSQQLGNDSYDAFNQVLQIALQKNVDFLLLGGDLFDEVNPSQKCLYRCLNTLRSKIFGGKKQFTLGVRGIQPNFNSENVNIGLPIFTIHGNHDYPSNDFGKISVCDLLHASNLVNYFGKKNTYIDRNTKKLKVTPLIFQKPNQKKKLALYGIGYIKDLKFHKLLQDKQVYFQQPSDKQNTLCILIIHQNRWKGKKGGVGASYVDCVLPRHFPQWIDLIIWGHQHEAIKKVQIEENRKIYQPGSTVITSYIEAESLVKQCLLITIGQQVKDQTNKYTGMHLQSISLLKSFRPMVIKSYSIEQILKDHGKQTAQQFDYESYFNEILQNILRQLNINQLSLRKPIIRIKIDYTGHQIVRLIRLQQKFSKAIANSFKIFKYSHKTIRKKDKISEMSDNQVFDFIKNKKMPNNHREIDLTTQVLDLYQEQFVKANNTFNFLDFNFINDKIQELTKNSDSKTSLNEISSSYKHQINQRCAKQLKQIQSWTQKQTQQYNNLKNQLCNEKNRVLKGQTPKFQKIHYQGLIQAHKNKYTQKQTQIKPIFEARQSSYQSKLILKKDNKQKNGQKKQKKQQMFQDSDCQDHSLEMRSDQDDCCKRAQKVEYRQKNAIQNFKMAEQMISDKQKKQRKKDFDFK